MSRLRTSIFFIILISLVSFDSYAFCGSLSSAVIEGQYSVTGRDDKSDEYCYFYLEGIDGAPMPEGSDGNNKTIRAVSGEIFSFGEVVYQKPGRYLYEVSRIKSDKPMIRVDDSVFDIMVEVLSDGSSVIIYQKRGFYGKAEGIAYTDQYIQSGSTGKANFPVKTGDTTEIFKYISTFLTALVALIMCHFLFLNKNCRPGSPRCPDINKNQEKGEKK